MKSEPHIQPARPGVLATAMPQLQAISSGQRDLDQLTKAIVDEPTLSAAALRLARGVTNLFRVDQAQCVWIDWPFRRTHSPAGPVEDTMEELVISVAGSGRRYSAGGLLVEPIGRVPARAVIVLCRPRDQSFSRDELQRIGALAIGIAPAMDRLIALARVTTG